MSETAGITNHTTPPFTQAGIDTRHPAGPGRQRYRLKGAGAISVDGVIVTGPQLGTASQLIWLAPATAAGFGDLVELAT